MRKWTDEMIVYLKEIYFKKTNQQIADLINKKFNTDFTKHSVQTKKSRLNLISETKFCRKYTPEVIEFILQNYKGRDNVELANMLNEKFNLDTNCDKVSMFKANYKRREGVDLRTGINRGCFAKGSVPMNKGKKWSEYLSEEQQERAKKTWFKKGNVSANASEIGAEKIRYSKDDDIGYICVKVCNGNKNKNWIPKHWLVYEKEYGPIPKGHKVIFLDGNRRNFEPSNLKAISYAEELIMNKNNLRYEEKELTETGHLIAQIISKRGKIKNERL